MPKAKPVSLHPLSFEEAVKALIRADPGNKKLERPKSQRKVTIKKK